MEHTERTSHETPVPLSPLIQLIWSSHHVATHTQRLTFLLATPSAKVHTAQQEDHQDDQQDTTNTSYSYADDCFGGQYRCEAEGRD